MKSKRRMNEEKWALQLLLLGYTLKYFSLFRDQRKNKLDSKNFYSRYSTSQPCCTENFISMLVLGIRKQKSTKTKTRSWVW